MASLGLKLAKIALPSGRIGKEGNVKLARGISMGNAVETQGRELMEMLGFPPQLFGMAQRFAIDIHRLKGSHGQYDNAGKIIINPDAGTATTLAHEWWHALDNYFGTFQNPKAVVTPSYQGAYNKFIADAYPGINVRPEVAKAFDNLYKIIFKGNYEPAMILDTLDRGIDQARTHLELLQMAGAHQSDIARAELDLEDMRKFRDHAEQSLLAEDKSTFALYAEHQDFNVTKKYYWSRPLEMTARAFEVYVNHKLGLNSPLEEEHFFPPSDEKSAPGECLRNLHTSADTALDKMHDIRGLASALLHVLGNAKERDREPFTTAFSLAGMIEEQATIEANRIDEISIGLYHVCQELKVGNVSP
ncbi:MAG: LPD1 domain-containing protein [Rhodomicrobium sp.]